MKRITTHRRSTRETEIDLVLEVDGVGTVDVSTGLPFFDHMLAQLAKHARFNLKLRCEGDLEIDAHHTVEDVGIALGEAFDEAMGDKAGVRRFASVTVPLDEAAVEVLLDLSGRPFLHYDITPPGEQILSEPPFDPQLCEEFWRGFVTAAGITMHMVMLRGKNTHHIIEASFKGAASALYDAVKIVDDVMPSTKGVL
ncbi:MAG: imidazoleglycerol-phosphate dehydratase HisB [Actinomycetia bacterium]|nr:imidazoleglycerol-phosphate dehydratase HisB [Actinomycetes bacterium]MCP4957637.1 imidazoleglycerol-phosphate dehydratase HisB [Actinomycetes bacterium]